MRVRVYRNLAKDCLSIQQYRRGVGWRVMRYVNQLVLHDVRFFVSEAGRQRVLATTRKNVHAFVEGFTTTDPAIPHQATRIRYNPRNDPHFTAENGEIVRQAKTVYLSTTAGIWAVMW